MLKLTPKNESIWKRLIELAIEFQKESPWNYFEEYQIFAVESPETKEINYCQLMGELGENLSLCVYKGNIGLNGYFKLVNLVEEELVNGNIQEDPFTFLQIQHCFQTTIEKKKDVEKESREILSKLGFKLTSLIPMFMDFTPGLSPWIISDDQALFMSHALEQTLIICERIKKNPDLIGFAEEDSKYLLRKSEMVDGKLNWYDSEVTPDFSFLSDKTVIQLVNTANFQKSVGKLPQLDNKVFFFDFFDIPVPYSPNSNKVRPYFPKNATCFDVSLDFENALIINKFIHPIGYEKHIEELFTSLFKKNRYRPQTIEVGRESTYNQLKPYLNSVDIKLTITENQQLLDRLYNPSFVLDELDEDFLDH